MFIHTQTEIYSIQVQHTYIHVHYTVQVCHSYLHAHVYRYIYKVHVLHKVLCMCIIIHVHV